MLADALDLLRQWWPTGHLGLLGPASFLAVVDGGDVLSMAVVGCDGEGSQRWCVAVVGCDGEGSQRWCVTVVGCDGKGSQRWCMVSLVYNASGQYVWSMAIGHWGWVIGRWVTGCRVTRVGVIGRWVTGWRGH
ncbi:unnamed protein product [Cuscuta epithymum]|uniref:Uncharacterized protein n=1 Tax=Cuscuta epithymum TaxID=186058 RepID=A0AAV0E7X8_9ASTE|nr:unnamed protein product [Cuscuta epithymum]